MTEHTEAERIAVIKVAIIAELDNQARHSVNMPYVGDPWGDPEEIVIDGTIELHALAAAIDEAVRTIVKERS